MNAGSLAVDALLAFGVAVELLCCLGVFAMRTAFDRLHYLGPAILFGPAAIAGAVMLAGGPLSQQGVKSFMILLVFLVTGPIMSYVTARVIRFRADGRLALRPGDKVQGG